MCVYVYIYLYLYLCILYSSKQTGSIYIYYIYIILYKHSLAWKSTLCVDRWSGKPKKSPTYAAMIFTSTPPALHLQKHFLANLDFGTPRPLFNVLADDNLWKKRQKNFVQKDPPSESKVTLREIHKNYATDPIFIKIRKVYHKTCARPQWKGQLKDDTQIWRNPFQLPASQHHRQNQLFCSSH